MSSLPICCIPPYGRRHIKPKLGGSRFGLYLFISEPNRAQGFMLALGSGGGGLYIVLGGKPTTAT